MTYFDFFQEKRAAQLKSIGVEESDIDTTHLVKESGKKKNYNIANKKQPPIIPGVKVKAEEKGKQIIFVIKVEKISEDSLESIPSPSPSGKIQIIGKKVYLR